MVVNELRNAIIDTIEFIIPPFVKLTIALFVTHYVTFGATSNYINHTVTLLKSQEISKLKLIIDNLYLGSVVPIIAILLLITVAYSINRTTHFIGILIPIYLHTRSTFHKPYSVIEIWKYFPEIKNVYELKLKVKQLLALAQIRNPTFGFDAVKWQEDSRSKKFQNIIFIKFLFTWSIASYLFAVKYLATPIHTNRLYIVISVVVILIITSYFMIIKTELNIEDTQLSIVYNFLKLEPEYKDNIATPVEIKEINRLLEDEQLRHSRWWSISIGYRLDWLLMYKHFRPPFYSRYQRWKESPPQKALNQQAK